MSVDLYQLSKLKLIGSLIAIAFLFACFPGKGGLEGAEREIDSIAERSDIRGFATSFLYSEWPILFGNWQFTLIVFQVILTWTGCYMFLADRIKVSYGMLRGHVKLASQETMLQRYLHLPLIQQDFSS